MKTLGWLPEKVSPLGGIVGEGILRLLGRPRLERLALLVRETAQNSLDAAMGQTGPISVSYDFVQLEAERRRLLTGTVFAETMELANRSEEFGSHLPLVQVLRHAKPLTGLFITDVGTRGLGGPVRADTAPAKDERSDYVDFILRVGSNPDVAESGGSFGYGRTIQYLVSKAQTIIVFTRTAADSRFVAASIVGRYEGEGTSYTGRNWWGRQTDRDLVVPVDGQDAERLGRALGFPLAATDRTGTSILILAPALNNPRKEVGRIPWLLADNVWPRMIEGSKYPHARFNVSYLGERLEIPDPTTTYPYRPFVAALEAVRDAEREELAEPGLYVKRNHVVEVRPSFTKRPEKIVGYLGLVQHESYLSANGPVRPRTLNGLTHTAQENAIALMRQAELIVSYELGEPHHLSSHTWVGVFRASETADPYFCDAEPASHDEWIPTNLPSSKRRFVRRGLEDVRDARRHYSMPQLPPDTGSGDLRMAEELSFLLPYGLGTGTAVDGGGGHRGGRSGGSRRSAVRIFEAGPAIDGRGRPVTEVLFEVLGDEADDPVAVRISPRFVEKEELRRGNSAVDDAFPEWLEAAGPVDGPLEPKTGSLVQVRPGTRWRLLGRHSDYAVSVALSIDPRVSSG